MVYPNPTSGDLSIDVGNTYSKVSVFGYNSLGQQVLSKEVSNSSSIDLKIEGDAGLYILKIQTADGKSARVRMVKK